MFWFKKAVGHGQKLQTDVLCTSSLKTQMHISPVEHCVVEQVVLDRLRKHHHWRNAENTQSKVYRHGCSYWFGFGKVADLKFVYSACNGFGEVNNGNFLEGKTYNTALNPKKPTGAVEIEKNAREALEILSHSWRHQTPGRMSWKSSPKRFHSKNANKDLWQHYYS